jgi:hypothetical protein
VSIALEFLNKFARIQQEIPGTMLDKNQFSMIRYTGKLNIAMNGKSTGYAIFQRVGATGWKP